MKKTTKPIIGMTALVDRGEGKQFMLNTYTESIKDAGGIPVMLHTTDDDESIARLAEMCDAFLFTGGHDVHPSMYGEEMIEGVGPCEERDAFEKKLLLAVLETDKPILAICRGMQLMNVVLGGSMYQDIMTQRPTDVEHRMPAPSDKVIHSVRITPDTPLCSILGTENDEINSYHHQCVKEVGQGLETMAFAPDGIIEGLYMPDKKFVLGVQWHPERLAKKYENAAKLFKAFIQAV